MFQSARIKLTAWYLLMIMVVSFFFSAIIYRAISFELERFEHMQRKRIEMRLQEDPEFAPRTPFGRRLPPPSPELLKEAETRVLYTLLGINAGIFVIAGGVGYFLAGRTLRPIGEMVDEQNRFISDASHELKTPLTSLRTAFEVYLRDKKPTVAEASLLISESLEDVKRLQSLSESLLTLTHYRTRNGHIPLEPVALREVIQKAKRTMHPLASDAAITIVTDIPVGMVMGDRHGLIQVFTILLENAVKYSPKKSTIRITAATTGSLIKVAIVDQGIGIDAAALPHIFDRFYRADSARSSHTGGYGLGLAIAKQVIDLHKGTIDVHSVPGSGTTFTVTLPLTTEQKNSA